MSRSANPSRFPKYAEIKRALLLRLYEYGGRNYALRAADTYEPLADDLKLGAWARRVTRAEYLGDKKSQRYWDILVQSARETLVKKSAFAVMLDAVSGC